MGIGVDVEDISRFQELDIENDSRFLNKIFTKKELDHCFSLAIPAQHLAARFAGKEAIIKASSSLGKVKPGYRDIEIENDSRGVPGAIIWKEGFDDVCIRLSLSHSHDVAVAFAIMTLEAEEGK